MLLAKYYLTASPKFTGLHMPLHRLSPSTVKKKKKKYVWTPTDAVISTSNEPQRLSSKNIGFTCMRLREGVWLGKL